MLGLGTAMARPEVVAFDIIDTMFDIAPLDDRLTVLGLPAGLHRRLYAEALRDSMALAVVNGFASFTDLMRSALATIVAEHGLVRSDADLQQALTVLRELPPHPDAGQALEALENAGIRVLALSNGAASATRALLERADLQGFVEEVLSVESVRLAKPRAEVYRYAVQTAGVAPEAAMLVACHPWDVHGARSAGLRGGYVGRGKPFPDKMGPHDLSGEQLLDVAAAIAALPA